MRLKKTQEVLRSLGKYVIQQSRSALSKKGKNTSKGLYESLGYDVETSTDGAKVIFTMANYARFVDQGVSGKEKKYNTPYGFKNKKPPMKPLMDWAKARNFRLRDAKGKYVKGNYKAIGFVLQNSIYKKGIKPSLFFTKPFNMAIDKYQKDIATAYLQDITDQL
tara:strand:+ start:3390 stop:3881 length:492 start_codon:yes stop_codon:yes gene_type:complete